MLQTRTILLELHRYMRTWPRRMGVAVGNLEYEANARLVGVLKAFPQSDPPDLVIEGNLKIVDEVAWIAGQYLRAYPVGGGPDWGLFAIEVIAQILAAVVPFIGGALGKILQTASNAVQALARAVAAGGVTATQQQAVIGMGITYALNRGGKATRLDDLHTQMKEVQALLG